MKKLIGFSYRSACLSPPQFVPISECKRTINQAGTQARFSACDASKSLSQSMKSTQSSSLSSFRMNERRNKAQVPLCGKRRERVKRRTLFSLSVSQYHQSKSLLILSLSENGWNGTTVSVSQPQLQPGKLSCTNGQIVHV